MAENKVWGFTIRKTPTGKNIWPNELKWEATRRIREDGQSPGDVAAELGAHECLVRKWSVADRRRRGEKIHIEGPAFAALSVEDDASVVETPRPASDQTGCGRILCGTVTIEFPLGISEGNLVKLMKVAGQLQ
ncbi:hypothetical protein [Ruegeria marina]|uniref:Transposase n=1 Tax=Ruegeria marina TaxID=639004 RepID=A0A1G7CS68_9RHOB|nr:hypothetical protein [Ruegeria marina]SDE42061.1 hypothetical protein SAMN04488239_1192 [Ruegeria marina]